PHPVIHSFPTRRSSDLQNQEIYFASALELNDPLEGYKDLFWKGDEIAWKNLLRHYLLCLMQTILRTLEHGPDYRVTAETLPVEIDRKSTRLNSSHLGIS